MVAYCGSVVKASVVLPVIVPRFTPPHVMLRAIEADMEIVFEPSLLWGTVSVLEISVLSPLPPMEPLQFHVVPFTVHEAVLVALEEIEDGLFSTNVIDKVEVLALVLVAVSFTVKTP